MANDIQIDLSSSNSVTHFKTWTPAFERIPYAQGVMTDMTSVESGV